MRSLIPKLIPIFLLLAACQRTFIGGGQGAPGGSLPGPASATPERGAQIEQVQGQVEARHAGGDWHAASDGERLSKDSAVRTAADSRVLIRLTEGSKVRLDPETLVELTILNPYLDSLLTSLRLEQGRVWIMLRDGALDVETPAGIAAARAAYMSVQLEPQAGRIDVSCLEGTCAFGQLFIPAGHKLDDAGRAGAEPEAMTFADYGAWGLNVPEATQLAYLATEAVAQGSATLPVVASATASATPAPPATETPAATTAPDQPTSTARPPTVTPAPSPTLPAQPRTATPIPFTPIPPAPLIGRHVVAEGETLFCVARAYGVLPAAIAQASGIGSPFIVFPGDVLSVPAVRWTDILPGPVCQPQFISPFPGLPYQTATPPASATPAGPPLRLTLNLMCLSNCGSQEGEYLLRVEALAEGGLAPYAFSPAQVQDLSLPHCVTATGAVSVASADGQTASAAWSYVDVNCPAP